jgi:hypothetical protein
MGVRCPPLVLLGVVGLRLGVVVVLGTLVGRLGVRGAASSWSTSRIGSVISGVSSSDGDT